MNKRRLIIVRHGESEANVNKDVYANTPDYKVQLTDKGREQIKELAIEAKLVNRATTLFYSPFLRTVQSKDIILENASFDSAYIKTFEDFRLREQEWGQNPKNMAINYESEKDKEFYGSYFYRYPNGESGADVELRISSFILSLQKYMNECDDDIILVSHGYTMRIIIKRLFTLSVDFFEQMRNPKNASCFILNNPFDYEYNAEKFIKDFKNNKTIFN
jgi:broad specificity phosphatase PhoE